MPQSPTEQIRSHLRTWAAVVAEATENGDSVGAYRLLRHVEAVSDTAAALTDPEVELPPPPVLARRFAHAHRRLAEQADCYPELVSALLLPGGTAVGATAAMPQNASR